MNAQGLANVSHTFSRLAPSVLDVVYLGSLDRLREHEFLKSILFYIGYIAQACF